MTRDEEIQDELSRQIPIHGGRTYGESLNCCWFEAGVKWADSHLSDETIMRILNCIGYEEVSWIGYVRTELEKRNGIQG